ncbi:hypothetical protein DWB85_10915 [Seongchinamella sediminis]|uniref:NIPSNAP protein n=1 Tax=Seongchinamella sediminis TaxID=2283635 RepID=A0A3L7DZ18_9GAMM|nr:hypothetical protein [Seongchinamella sediminis]RLQ21790.1 hypothetical protein DWB85_10915 [Seongchinamella sediminis]
MKRTATAALLAGASTLFFYTSVNAQQEQEPPSFAAIDAYLCNYRDGKDAEDLMQVTQKWNKWMDRHGAAPYSAWILHPVLSSTNMPIDVVWLGAWQNGNDMGKGMQAWSEKGGELGEEFEEVIDCAEHSLAASVNIRPPSEGWPGETGVVAFTNCALGDGKSVMDAMKVHRAWAEHLASTGSKAGMWAFFPAAGQADIEWSHKIVVGHPDYLSYGADWERFANGQGWRKAMELTAGGEVSCDSPRVYHSVTVRNDGINPAGG